MNKEINASAKWDWNSDGFCHDIDSYWTGIYVEDIHAGIGRLIYETQRMTEYLIIWQAMYSKFFCKANPNFTRENIESCKTIQDMRRSTLGRLITLMNKGGVKFKYTKDEDCLYGILLDRNYFVHVFYSEYLTLYEGEKLDFLNRNVRRLKKAINTIVKFNNRNTPLIEDALERMR